MRSLRVKLLLLTGGATAVLLAIGVASLWLLGRLADDVEVADRFANGFRAHGQADMRHDALRGDVAVALAAATPDDVAQAQRDVASDAAEFRAQLATLRGLALSPAIDAQIDAVMPRLDAYAAMVRHLEDSCYTGVTRYTGSAFLRMKLGDALEQRDVAPYIYESVGEARRHVREAQSGLTEEELAIASYGGAG